MKKIVSSLIFLMLFASFSFSVWADTKNEPLETDPSNGFYFTINVGAGVQFGVLTEIFYEKLSDESFYKKSWLRWETLPVFLGSFENSIGYNFSKYHSRNLSAFFSFAVPDFAGAMEDFDALLYDGKITDYSYHDNYIDSIYSTGFYTDYSFLGGFGISIGLEFQTLTFLGENGYAQHNSDWGWATGYWNANMPYTSTYEGNIVISYEAFSFYWKPGIVFRHSFTDDFRIGFGAWSYLYRFSQAEDIHYKFNPNVPIRYFTDIIETWFSGFEIQASTEYAIQDKFSLSLRIVGKYLPDVLGDDYTGKPPDHKLNEDYKGGFAAWSVSANVAAVLRL